MGRIPAAYNALCFENVLVHLNFIRGAAVRLPAKRIRSLDLEWLNKYWERKYTFYLKKISSLSQKPGGNDDLKPHDCLRMAETADTQAFQGVDKTESM